MHPIKRTQPVQGLDTAVHSRKKKKAIEKVNSMSATNFLLKIVRASLSHDYNICKYQVWEYKLTLPSDGAPKLKLFLMSITSDSRDRHWVPKSHAFSTRCRFLDAKGPVQVPSKSTFTLVSVGLELGVHLILFKFKAILNDQCN